MVVGAEAGNPVEFAELGTRRHVAGRLSVELNAGPPVDQFRNPLLRDAVFSPRLINFEHRHPRWSASVHLALRVNAFPITTVIGILIWCFPGT